jgi:hypothetical protein
MNRPRLRCILLGMVFAALGARALAQDSPFDTTYFPYRAFDALPATEIRIGGSSVLLAYAPGGEFALSKAEIALWVEGCARIVAGYYGRFPVAKYRLLVMPSPGIGVRGGTTWGFRGGATKLRLGQGAHAAYRPERSTPRPLGARWFAACPKGSRVPATRASITRIPGGARTGVAPCFVSSPTCASASAPATR